MKHDLAATIRRTNIGEALIPNGQTKAKYPVDNGGSISVKRNPYDNAAASARDDARNKWRALQNQ